MSSCSWLWPAAMRFARNAHAAHRRGADASYAQRHTGPDLGDDGSTLVIGAPFSGATPGMPDELSGAVYVYDGLF